jgi:hypothetical protein
MTIRHQEFLRELAETNYPFTPTATLTNGTLQLSRTMFSDCTFYPAVSDGNLFLSRVTIDSGRMQLFVGDRQTNELLQGTVTTPVTVNRVTLRDKQDRAAGLILSDPSNLGVLFALGLGTHEFTREQTEFCASCHVPLPATTVSGFRLPNGETVSGEVWLVGSSGVVLRAIPSNGETIIRVDMVGDPLYLQRLCGGAGFDPIVPLRRIRIVNGEGGLDAAHIGLWGIEADLGSSGESADEPQIFVTPPGFECEASTVGNFSLQMNNALIQNTALRVHTTAAGVVIEVAGSSF